MSSNSRGIPPDDPDGCCPPDNTDLEGFPAFSDLVPPPIGQLQLSAKSEEPMGAHASNSSCVAGENSTWVRSPSQQ
ncbi:unnamed protein product [Nippostrongylus brasiliensis]|uniref:Uncharacterized protein n=1 Tax=Nippostrongylus brasiliensis TaxID=27835 RepID=A0A0N4Y8V4_NIPBR|nr:hypothetical protein Q1695_014846 [Nippostrongylus brasiliensis]VDL76275.1 unnamed protein product [Nippostrongylus brasiliensis]